MGVDCKFLNLGVNIEKALKLHGLKVNFSLKSKVHNPIQVQMKFTTKQKKTKKRRKLSFNP
jgi:hypothetical protein